MYKLYNESNAILYVCLLAVNLVSIADLAIYSPALKEHKGNLLQLFPLNSNTLIEQPIALLKCCCNTGPAKQVHVSKYYLIMFSNFHDPIAD